MEADEREGFVVVGSMSPQGRGDGPMPSSAQETEGKITKGGQHLRRSATADLAAVLVEGDIANPMHAVLDAPVSPPKGEQSVGVGSVRWQAGHRVGHVVRGFAPASDPSFYATDLGQGGPIAVAHQLGGSP